MAHRPCGDGPTRPIRQIAAQQDSQQQAPPSDTGQAGSPVAGAATGPRDRATPVIDIASHRVVGYAMADHLRTELISDALSNAVAARDPVHGVIFHSDRGCPVHLGRLRWPR